jgi:hypothetical protein
MPQPLLSLHVLQFALQCEFVNILMKLHNKIGHTSAVFN